jgi:hypothetical protein
MMNVDASSVDMRIELVVRVSSWDKLALDEAAQGTLHAAQP